MGEVIPHRIWRNKKTLVTRGLFGAVPWGSDDEKHDWELVNAGWTVRHPDGTTGVGRFAFETKAEAEAWVEKNPTYPGNRQD